MLSWFGQYESDKKSLSRASPSVGALGRALGRALGLCVSDRLEVLTGVEVAKEDRGKSEPKKLREDDVLFLKELPSFNGAATLGGCRKDQKV